MISWGEITVVFFIALLLFGADKIPEFARTAGKMMGEYRKVRDSLRDELDNVKDEVEEVKTHIEKVTDVTEIPVERISRDNDQDL